LIVAINQLAFARALKNTPRLFLAS